MYHVWDIFRKFLGHNFGSGLRIIEPKNLKPKNLKTLKNMKTFSLKPRFLALYNTRVRENVHFDSVSTNYGKRTVRYKASKIWNQVPLSVKEFYLVKYFSNKLKEFLQVVDIDSKLIFNVWLWSCLFVFLYKPVLPLSEHVCLSVCPSVCLSVCLSVCPSVCLWLFCSVSIFANCCTYLGDQLRWAFTFLIAGHCVLCSIYVLFCRVGWINWLIELIYDTLSE